MSLATRLAIANVIISVLIVMTMNFMALGTEASLVGPIEDKFSFLFNTTKESIPDYTSQTNPNNTFISESESISASSYSRFENFLSFGAIITMSFQIIGLSVAPLVMYGIFYSGSSVINALMVVFFSLWQMLTIMAIVQFLTSGGRE